MKPIKYIAQFVLLFFMQGILLWSCKQEKKAPPFPVYETEFEQPYAKSFKLSATDTLQWSTAKLRPTASLPSKKFNWNKLPSETFDLGQSYPFVEPLPNQQLDWESLPSTNFDYDSLPTKNLNIRVTLLGPPKIVKAGPSEKAAGASRGIMTFDEDFGYPGIIMSHFIDKDGMVWLAGNSGIAKYDGDNLHIYDQEQGFKTTDGIFVMFQDSKGRIWTLGNSGSVLVIDLKANLVLELISEFGTNPILGILEAKDGKFWISNGDNGYHIIDLEQMIIKQFAPVEGATEPFSISVMQDKEGLIWLAGYNGINIIDADNKKNISLTKEHGLLSEVFFSVLQDNEENIWIGGNAGVSVINGAKDQISYMSEIFELKERNIVSKIYQSKEGVLWMGTDQGLLVSYDAKVNTVRKIKINETEEQAFIFGIGEDKQGQVWVSSFDKGIFFINLEGGRPANFAEEEGVKSTPVWSILESADKKIWMGGENGIDILDPENNSISHLNEKDGLINNSSTRILEDSKGRIWSFGVREQGGVNIIDPKKETIQQFATQEFLKGNSIASLLEDSQGNFWLGGSLGTLFFVDFENELFKEVIIDTISERTSIDNIIEDQENRIWIAGRNFGIHILDPSHQFRTKLGADQGLISDQIFSLYRDDQNYIWTATFNGVERIDPKQNQLLTFTTKQGLAANDVYTIIQQEEKIFLGTSKGLTVLKNEHDSNEEKGYWNAVTIGKKQGLEFLDFHMNSFEIDSEGSLWAGVDSEVVTVIDELENDSTAYPVYITGLNIFDEKQSFYDLQFIEEKLVPHDSIWAWQQTDYQLVKKEKIDSVLNSPKNLEWTQVNGPYSIPTDLQLPYTQNYLSFNFNAAQFRNADKVVYRYFLEGIDKSWSSITKNTISENYRDLAPGDYAFKVVSKGYDGVWSQPAELRFTIIPPWWRTWWAYTIFVALFLGLGLVILHYRSRWLKKENKILEERVNERTSELKKTINELENTQSQLIQSEKMASLGELTAGIAHEIQNPMNFINNFSEVTIELVDEMCEELDKGEVNEAKDISKDIVQNLEKITHHGKRASSIVKGMLEHSRNSSGKKEFIDLNVLSDEYLRLAYHGLRAKDKSFNADFKTDFDETLPKIEIIPQDLGRVVLNIINNAFFAVTSIPEEQRDENYKPLVTVSTKNLKNQAMISIKDNGPGIPEDIKDKIFQPFFTTKETGKGTGLGLSLAYDIVTTGHGGAIELNTELGKGTEFVIYIPIRK